MDSDFTSGSVGKHLIRFSMPFLLSNFLQALYSVADMLIVGRFCPAESLSGVTNGAQITNLVVMMISGLTVGGTVLVAQYYGARKLKDVSETIGTTFTLMMVIGAVLTVAMLLLSDVMIRLINVPAEAVPETKSYMNICLCGTLFIFGYNAISAVQRGMGDSKRPMYFVAIACAVNVGLDLLLVAVFHMGAAGAALATIISQGLSMVLAAIYLRRKNFVFDFKLKSFKICPDKARLLVKVGLPNSVQSTVTNVSFLIMTGIVNGFGVYASAAVGISGRFNSFAILPAVAMSAAVSSMAAQNVGAGSYDRARRAMRSGMAIAFVLGAAVFAVAQIFAADIMLLFMGEYNEQIVSYGVQYMRAFSFDYLLVPFVFCFNGLLNGAGHTTFTLVNSMLSSIILRMPMAIILSKTSLKLSGVGLAAPIASLLGIALSLVFVLSGRWEKSVTGIRRDAALEE